MSIRTSGRRMGQHTPREKPVEPSLGEKIRQAAQSAGTSIKEAIRPSLKETPEQRLQAQRAEAEALKQPITQRSVSPKHTKREERMASRKEPIYSEEDAAKALREQLTGEEVKEPEMVRGLSAAERRERKRLLREQKRKTWAESSENANNKKGGSAFIEKAKETAKEFAEDVKGDVKAIVHGREPKESKEPETPEEPEEPKEEIKLYGTSQKYRVDQDGILYRPGSSPGKWISTGKPSQYGIPKEVDEGAQEEERGSKKKSREPPETGGGIGGGGDRGSPLGGEGGRELKPALSSGVLGRTGATGSGFDEDAEKQRLASFEKQGSALHVGSGYIYAGKSGGATGSGYDEGAERRRLASFEKQGSALHVGSGYISGGSYRGSGYDAEKEKKRLEEISKAGSPLSAGMSYLSAGQYKTTTKPQQEVGKLDIKSSDVYSTGQFKFGYGSKKQPIQEIEPDKQLEVEMAKLASMQTRQAQIAQLAEIQEMQRSLQKTNPQVSVLQPQPQEAIQKPMSNMEMLFGVKMGAVSKPTTKKAAPVTIGKSAVEDFFGIKYATQSQAPKSKTAETQVIGEFGGRKIKHTQHDIKMYQPKNNLPETKGGFFGLFEKTAKMGTKPLVKVKKVKGYQQKKIKPTATEFLFGKQR